MVKISGNAKKKNKGWHVEFGPEFKKQLPNLPPEVQKELHSLISGIEDGSIDPTTMGKRMCGYCGDELVDMPLGESMCKTCSDEMK